MIHDVPLTSLREMVAVAFSVEDWSQTDICAGRVLEQAVVRETEAGPDFQHDFAEADFAQK